MRCGDAAELFTWSVHTSKYGKQCKYSQKMRGKKRKKRIDMMWTFVDSVGVLLAWSVHIIKEGK